MAAPRGFGDAPAGEAPGPGALDGARASLVDAGQVVGPPRDRAVGWWEPQSPSELRSLHERFATDPAATDLSVLRPVIARSWLRSIACKVSPGLRIFDEIREPRLDELVLRCAEPVLTELERISTDTGAGICLADPVGTLAVFRGDAQMLRWAERAGVPPLGSSMAEEIAGTNGEGTVIEEGRGVQVWGAEHFAEGLQDFCCTSVPIRDPMRNTIRAILSLTMPERVGMKVDPRSIAWIVEGAAAEVTRLLAARLAVREQALLTSYLAEVRKRGADSVVVMDDRTTIASKGALEMLEQSDYAVLSGYAHEAQRLERPVEHEVTLAPTRVLQVQARPIASAGETIGSVIRLRAASAAAVGSGRRAARSAPRGPFVGLVGDSLALRRALEIASTAVARRMPAHIVGERGTGKTLLAEAMAGALARDVVVIDCASEADTDPLVLEAAGDALRDGAAVVLRHADELPAGPRSAVAALVSAFENPPVFLTLSRLTDDAMLLASALRGVEVTMPPLRNRREDIPQLVAHVLASSPRGVERVSAKLLRALAEADWPRNVEQLREFVETAVDRCNAPVLDMEHMSDAHRRTIARKPLTRLEEAELQQIRDALADAGGNRVKTAELLQIGRSTLYRKIEMYTRRGFSLE